jgi:hypothetical protein
MKASACSLLCAVLLTSCTSKDTPSGTVRAFLDAGREGDRAGLLRHIEKKDRAFLEKMEGQGAGKTSLVPPKGSEFKIKGEKIDAGKATVEVVTIENGKETTNTVNLVLEDGAWVVDLVPDQMLDMLKGIEGAVKESAR